MASTSSVSDSAPSPLTSSPTKATRSSTGDNRSTDSSRVPSSPTIVSRSARPKGARATTDFTLRFLIALCVSLSLWVSVLTTTTSATPRIVHILAKNNREYNRIHYNDTDTKSKRHSNSARESNIPTMTDDEKEAIFALVRQAKEAYPEDLPWSNITKLDLSGKGLSSLPDHLPIALPNLSILFLSNNNFTQVPAVIGRCPQLQMIAFKSNHNLTSIHPDALQPQLRWLILTDNKLSSLPPTIGQCTKLQKCMLSGNRLTELPPEMGQCANLELLRLSSNLLTAPPTELLKAWPRLAWVALGDNPFLDAITDTAAASTPSVPLLTDVDEANTDNVVLGKGASGVTVRVWYRDEWVAVKQYAGNTTSNSAPEKQKDGTENNTATKKTIMTSDGSPDRERAISVAVSELKAPALLRVLGETPRSSLVLEYVPNATALADPPSLTSCSRDVYDDVVVLSSNATTDAATATLSNKKPYTVAEAHVLVGRILDALTELHTAGICHGDVYGHNILVPRRDLPEATKPSTSSTAKPWFDADMWTVKLSDFGAAFRYDPTAEYGMHIEAIELRALAVLAEEMAAVVLGRLPDPNDPERLYRPVSTPPLKGSHNDDETGASDAKDISDDESAVKDGAGQLLDLALKCRTGGATFEAVQFEWHKERLAEQAREFQRRL